MTPHRMKIVSVVAVTCAVLALPVVAQALPKGTKWQNCTAKDLNTRFGSSCMNQADQDISPTRMYCSAVGAECCAVR